MPTRNCRSGGDPTFGLNWYPILKFVLTFPRHTSCSGEQTHCYSQLQGLNKDYLGRTKTSKTKLTETKATKKNPKTTKQHFSLVFLRSGSGRVPSSSQEKSEGVSYRLCPLSSNPFPQTGRTKRANTASTCGISVERYSQKGPKR